MSTYLFWPMRRHISRQLAKREQKDGEPMRIYAQEVLTLDRQHSGFRAEEILDRLYHNMISEARVNLPWKQVRSIYHLIRRVEEWELHTKAAQDRKAAALATDDTRARSVTYYGPNECCRRCGQKGHRHWDCRKEERMRCEAYGTEDTPTRYCHPRRPGNGGRVTPLEPLEQSAESKTTNHTSGRRSESNDSRPSSTPAPSAP
jgi:hypothetical protein